MEFSRFIADVRRNELRSAYLFLGKEDFLAETGVQELIARLLTPDEKELNLTVVTARDAESIALSLSTPPLFAARRVILVKQAGDLAGPILEVIAAYLKNPPSDACLILWAGEVDKRKIFYRKIVPQIFDKKIVPLIEPVLCNKLKPSELQTWITEYAKKYGKRLDSEAANRLGAVNWPSLRELAGELDRLTLMIGEKSVITTGDIEEMGGASFAFDRWRLSEAIGEGGMTAAVTAVNNLLDWGTKPPQIVGDIYRVLRQLWFIRWHIDQKKIAEAKSKLKLQDFIFAKLQRQAGATSLAHIEEAILRVLDAELSIKRGQRQDDLEAITLVTEVISALSGRNRKKGAA